LGFKSTRLGGKSLNGLGIEGLITDKEARQGDNNGVMMNSISEAASVLSQLYNSTLELLDT